MIEYISGKVAELTAAYVVIDCGGVGYLANISLGTYTALINHESAKVFVYEAIREDAYQLFGFATRTERQMFEMLISVSGVGANTARIILSAYPPAELQRAIMSEDANTLKSIKGIGLKSAQRIIVELKDKVSKLGLVDETKIVAASNNKTREDALNALEVLGYARLAATKAVDSILKKEGDITVEELIKKAIRAL